MSVTPDFIGQIYKDTNNGNLWRANSLTPGDWTLELQNGQVKWLPHTIKAGELIGYSLRSGLLPLTELTFEQSTITEPILINSSSITAIRFPNLLTVDPDYWWGSDLDFGNCTALTTLELPLLQVMGSGSLKAVSCSSLTSLITTSLVTVAENIDFEGCNILSNVSFPNLLPTNGKLIRLNIPLTEASVDGMLARGVANPAYVSGTMALGGSPPSAAGITNKNILLGRGVSVSTS